ncbi:hypothetical protein V8B97DRAFT_1923470 [Scleroderma yunnanense]
MSSGRKRPQCHRCGAMMEGHTRKGRGKFICPGSSASLDSSGSENGRADSEASITDLDTKRSHSHFTPLPSPPVSSSPSPTPTPTPTPVPPPAYTPTFNPPPGDYWHWKNPNWKSPPRNTGADMADASARASLAPTEPNTEYQSSIQGDYPVLSATFQVVKQEPHDGLWETGDNEIASTHSEYFDEFAPTRLDPASSRSWSPYPCADGSLSGMLRESTPLFKVFRTRRKDVSKVTHAAEEEGKHVCVINAPPHYPGTAKLPREKVNGTVWVLVSDREDDLKYALDSQQRGMPGTMFLDDHTVKKSGFLEVVLAGLVGGLAVACGFKYL